MRLAERVLGYLGRTVSAWTCAVCRIRIQQNYALVEGYPVCFACLTSQQAWVQDVSNEASVDQAESSCLDQTPPVP